MSKAKVSMLDVFELDTPIEVVAGDKPFTPRDMQMVCMLIALGETAEHVARKLNVSPLEVEKVLKSDEGLELIIRMQSSLCPDPLVRVKKLANLALDAQLKLLLRSTSDSTVAKVASDILDRACGKAVQTIESRNLSGNITDMTEVDRALASQREKLDRLERQQRRLLDAKV